ncbi:hypothetical protein ACFQE0_07745 [Methylobacterium komagatae]|uniref:Uncharacterized protein n=1 Tax=Methylobacterium komagatae TaxID=374425 RepID=A0ABW2BHI6_9HYPH
MNADVERIRSVLAELIKAALLSDDAKSLACREEASTQIAAVQANPPDPAHVRMDGAWTLAIQDAETPELTPEEGQVSLTLPRQCLFTLNEMLAPNFDRDEAVERIRKSASTG